MPRQHQHCDTRKGNDALRWNPADRQRRVEGRIGYGIDGTIRSNDPLFDAQLNEVLNLNLARIKRNREASLHAVAQWYTRTQPDRQRVEREIDRRLVPPIMAPYVPVVIWWLERKL